MKKIMITVGIFLLLANNCRAFKLEYSFSDQSFSDYITRSGGEIGKGPVNQATLTLGLNSWYAYGFHNFDFALKRENEHDFGLGKSFSLGTFLLDLSYQKKWLDQCQETAMEAKLEYECPVNLSLIWTKVITDGIYTDWNRFYLEIKKPFLFRKLTISPMLSTAYLNNFYAGHGFAHATGGILADYPLGKNFSLSSSVRYQKGLMKTREDIFYGGIGCSLNL